jgi:translation initiation factor 1 (eIF-1/SUI1)
VTTVFGFDLDIEAFKILGKDLKQQCGTGETVKDGIRTGPRIISRRSHRNLK